jgi:crossover junction endodeoxyribonuclease RuvC
VILGIDPGQNGGVALINRHGALQFAEGMPVARNAVVTVDVRQLGHLLTGRHGVFAFVERAQAMPRQGVSSAFNYGCIFGSILTALADLGIGYELVAPAKWKRDFGLQSDKRQAIDRAQQLYPALRRLRAKDDGVAEALLIARWGLTHGLGVSHA